MTTVQEDTTRRTRSQQSTGAAHQLMLRDSGLSDTHFLDVYTQLSEQDVEQHLRAALVQTADETQTINVWDYVHQSRIRSVAEGVQEILIHKVEAVQGLGFDLGVLMQFALSRQVWKDHTDPALRSRDAWLQSLEDRRSIAAGMMIGFLGENNKQKCLISITQNWGDNWYDSFDTSIRPPKPYGELTKSELEWLAKIASSGKSLQESCVKLKSAVTARRQRTRKLKDHRWYVTRQDLESLGEWVRSSNSSKVNPHRQAGKGKRSLAQRKSRQNNRSPENVIEVPSEEHSSTGEMSETDYRAAEPSRLDGTPADESSRNNGDSPVIPPDRRPRASSDRTIKVTVSSCSKEIQQAIQRLRELVGDNLDIAALPPCLRSKSEHGLPDCVQALCQMARDIDGAEADDTEGGCHDECEGATQDGDGDNGGGEDAQDTGNGGSRSAHSASIDHLIENDFDDESLFASQS